MSLSNINLNRFNIKRLIEVPLLDYIRYELSILRVSLLSLRFFLLIMIIIRDIQVIFRNKVPRI